jgi:hypothetical protein
MFETTPDTRAYLIAGYSVIVGGLLLYVMSLIVRWRALAREERWLAEVEHGEKK